MRFKSEGGWSIAEANSEKKKKKSTAKLMRPSATIESSVYK